MQTAQVQCRLEVKGMLQKTFPLLSDCGRFVLNIKKWKYTTYITSSRSLNNLTACAFITTVSAVKGHRAISGV